MSRRRTLWEEIRHWMAWSLHGAMTCEEFEAGLVDYLDGTMGSLGRGRIDLHTRTCPHCKRYLQAYDRARKLAADSLREAEEKTLKTVPEELVQAVLAARRADVAR